jgi:broad specificity phosphatase PhoE
VSGVSEVWIVQHAEKEREAADPADPGLTERGRRQARRTAAHLRAAGRFDVISSSPLRRAHQTAEVIGQHLGLPMRLDPRLRERMNWGERAPEAAGSPPQPLEEFLREWERTTRRRDYVPTSGDSSRAAGERFQLFLEELAAVAAAPDAWGHPGLRRAVLVSHGGVTVDLLRTLFGDDAVRAAAAAAIDRGMPGCGITRLRRRGDAWELVGVGDVAHLAGDESEWPAS